MGAVQDFAREGEDERGKMSYSLGQLSRWDDMGGGKSIRFCETNRTCRFVILRKKSTAETEHDGGV